MRLQGGVQDPGKRACSFPDLARFGKREKRECYERNKDGKKKKRRE